MKPTYLCIGIQKAGTTSLINYLNSHPEIYCYPKECHFFDKEDIENIENYENLFQTDKKIIGEKTPNYIQKNSFIDTIAKIYPNIKLIIILREPISRAYSRYNNELMNSNNKSLTTLTKKNGVYIKRGYYFEKLQYVYSKFPKENIYIGIAEEIKENKLVEYNKIYQFLGAKPLSTINENLDSHIRSYKNPLSRTMELAMYKIYKQHNEKLYKLLGRRIDSWEKYYQSLE